MSAQSVERREDATSEKVGRLIVVKQPGTNKRLFDYDPLADRIIIQQRGCRMRVDLAQLRKVHGFEDGAGVSVERGVAG